MHVLIFLLVIMVASYFQGIVGFGQGLIAAPLALVLFSKYEALSAMLAVGLVLSGFLVLRIKDKLDTQLMKVLVAGAILGLPIGLLAVHIISLNKLQVAAGIFAIISAVLIVFSNFRATHSKSLALFTGGLAGFLQTTIGMSGPPVVLFLNAEATSKQTMRKLLPAFFLMLGLSGALLYGVSGLLRVKGLGIGILASPLVLLAGSLGNTYSSKISQDSYRIITLATVVLTGILAIFEGITH